MNVDTMYYHQAKNKEESADFIEAVVNEVDGHVDNKNWKLVPIEDVPEVEEPLPSVWAMHSKKKIGH